MEIRENIPLKPKTTMRIGGSARYYADLQTPRDAEEAVTFAQGKHLPLIVLGGGSNTIFEDGVIEALVVRIVADSVRAEGGIANIEAGKNLMQLIYELARQNLDLSPLTGILGTVGGAIFGNAGQGPNGTWIDTYVESVTALMDGAWRTLPKKECSFRYRESEFKDRWKKAASGARTIGPMIWSTTLRVPERPQVEIEREIARLLKRRIETQPHVKTAGSCFKAIGKTPAWQLIDAAGLRGNRIGGVTISEKHANFLINEAEGSFADAMHIVEAVKDAIPENLEVEMRFVGKDGEVMEW